MNTVAIRSLFLLSSRLKIEQRQLYQLIRAAESCYCLKDAEGQLQLGLILQEFPNPVGAIGDYYKAFYLTRTGAFEESQRNLEHALIYAPESYKAKSLLALSSLEERRNNFDDAVKLRIEASLLNKPQVTLKSQLGIAALMGMQGDHHYAAKHLEQFLPLAYAIGPSPVYLLLRACQAGMGLSHVRIQPEAQLRIHSPSKLEEVLRSLKPPATMDRVVRRRNYLSPASRQGCLRGACTKAKRSDSLRFERATGGSSTRGALYL
jgi:tetratricopeptide (TPR) repeat protein